jgi:hypothetical protein
MNNGLEAGIYIPRFLAWMSPFPYVHLRPKEGDEIYHVIFVLVAASGVYLRVKIGQALLSVFADVLSKKSSRSNN